MKYSERRGSAVTIKPSKGYMAFSAINHIFLILSAVICFVPVFYIFSISLNESHTIYKILLLPVDFTTRAYSFLLSDSSFWNSMLISIKRVVMGVSLQMFLVVLTAYPLSKRTKFFPSRKYYIWYFVVTMFFSGGLIPTYFVVFYTGLIDSIWALIIPSAMQVWNVVLLLNFFRNLPGELEEAAFIDGAGHWRILWRIIVPLSKPALATITLFCMVGHWNDFFSGIIYMNNPGKYPLQTFIYFKIMSAQTLSTYASISPADIERFQELSARNLNAAQIFLSMVPIFCVYPYLQKYFTKGIILGSVKG